MKRKSFTGNGLLGRLLFVCALLPFGCVAQTLTYTLDSTIRSAAERVNIQVTPASGTRSTSSSISLPGTLGTIVTLGIDVVKSILSAQEAKYTAIYAASYSGKDLIISAGPDQPGNGWLNIAEVHVQRVIISKDLSSDIAEEIVLTPEMDKATGLFRFKLRSLDMLGSKARIVKRRFGGQFVDLSIDIKMDAIWKESSVNKDTSAKTENKAQSPGKQENTTSYKTGILGQSTILVSGVKPTKGVLFSEDHYSGWFQLPPVGILTTSHPETTAAGNYTITITVKEANPYTIRGKNLNAFLTSNSSDVNALIKQLSTPAAK